MGKGHETGTWVNLAFREATRKLSEMHSRLVTAPLPLALALVGSGASPARVWPQVGFTTAAAPAEASFETRLIAVPDTQAARDMTRDLSARPHMAGTLAQAATRDYVLAKLKAWDLQTWTKTYTVYVPQPLAVGAWLVPRHDAPSRRLALAEPAGDQVLPFNAYTGDGDVTADVVYVNYGLITDYQTLDSLGVSVRGRIVIARYGRSFRGIKAREARRRRARGLILYSDPQDDGYDRGDVYPAGPMRPPGGIQRGSVLNANGDPTTPGYPSLPGVHRVPEESLPLPGIPVIPMGYGNAQRILATLRGPAAPEGWQGGLAFHYHVGPGTMRVRLRMATEHGERALHPIWNAFGMIRGATYPDEWVVVGAHRDAWCPGAGDNISGTVTVLEAARAFAALARVGVRPARTVIFASWDAEEWALIGSTEWVEEMEDSLREHVVAYLNEDDVTTGPRFEGAASPSLKPLLVDVTHLVPAPGGPGTVHDAWRGRTADTTTLRLDDLGGGSDFAGFSHHLGIPSLSARFDGPSGVYHSTFDSYDWMSRFGDPGYLEHRAVAQVVALTAARLANADVLPLDYAAFGAELGTLVAELDSGIARRQWRVSTSQLAEALARLTAAGRAFAAVRDSALAAGPPLLPARAAQVNHWLMQVERRLTRPQGLVSRPWYRSLQFASDLDNGYSTMAFPSISEAIRYADAATTERELADLVTHVDQARDAVEQAVAALR